MQFLEGSADGWAMLRAANVMANPEKVNQPNAPAQHSQPMRIRLVMKFLAPFNGCLKIGFAAYASDRSACSAAMSYNLRQAIAGECPDLAVDPKKALLNRGKLPLTQGVALAFAHQKLFILRRPDLPITSFHHSGKIARRT